MTCAECGNKVDVDMVRDVERMRAVLERLVADQATTSWKADYAYRNTHRHMSTGDLVLIAVCVGVCVWAVWGLLFPPEGETV